MESEKLMRPEDNGNASRGLDFPSPMVPPGDVPVALPETALLDYWRILVKRKAVVLITLAVVFSLAALRTYRTTPLYESTGRVAVYHESQALTGFKESGAIDADDWDYTVAMETQVRIMQSDSLALKVAHDLGWEKAFAAPAAGAIPLASPLTAQQESGLIGRLHGSLQVSSIP